MEGLMTMKAGGKAQADPFAATRLWRTWLTAVIPPNAEVIFEVELLEVR